MKALPARWMAGAALAAVLMAAGTLASPAHAWLGALAKLGKIGSAAGKGAAGAAGKGAATGAGALAGAEAIDAAGHVAKTARTGAAAEGAGGASAATAEQVSKASGLGKAVPDDIAAMLTTPGKTLADVPDIGVRSWLEIPAGHFNKADPDLMMRDYARLVEGKPALGPPQLVKARTLTTPAPVTATTTKTTARAPDTNIPWFAVELLVRAAHIGHKNAQTELKRLCHTTAAQTPRPGLKTDNLLAAQCDRQRQRQASAISKQLLARQ